MPFIKSHPNRKDDDDESEEGRDEKDELLGEKELQSHDGVKSDESEKEANEIMPEEIKDEYLEAFHVSEMDGHEKETDEDILSQSKEEDIFDENPNPEVEEEDPSIVRSLEPQEFMPSSLFKETEEFHFIDTGPEYDFGDREAEDVDNKVATLRYEDEYDLSESEEEESEAYVSGTAGLYYLRGLLCHQKMNLDDAIRYLGKSLELAVEMDLFDYVVKSQIQLAVIRLKRYRIHGNKKDYYSSLHYSENLIQIAKELELDELWTEALLLRAILRKIAKDVYGARDDLNQARAMAKSTGQASVGALIEHELQEVRRLVARAKRKKQHDEDNGESMMDEALEAIPAIFDESLKLEVSRESLEISVELSRLVIMNLASGLPLYTYSFDGQIDKKSDLVYGFLSALSHLASEVIDHPGMIRSISHEGSTVMMEHKGAYMAALFASREDFRARQSVQKFLKEFLRIYPEMRLGEVISEEHRMAANELLLRIFKDYL
ncbi:MAG: hypothetical protein ACFFCX_17430 [Candidatus Sifarchaeia archaeon]